LGEKEGWTTVLERKRAKRILKRNIPKTWGGQLQRGGKDFDWCNLCRAVTYKKKKNKQMGGKEKKRGHG